MVSSYEQPPKRIEKDAEKLEMLAMWSEYHRVTSLEAHFSIWGGFYTRPKKCQEVCNQEVGSMIFNAIFQVSHFAINDLGLL